MNTLKFEVYKNTLKRRDGFNPVLGEKTTQKSNVILLRVTGINARR